MLYKCMNIIIIIVIILTMEVNKNSPFLDTSFPFLTKNPNVHIFI